jgi:hypothetical protein
MPRLGDLCAGCQHGFEVGEMLLAHLYATPEGYVRRDYCCRCQPPETPSPVGVWRTRRPEPNARKAATFDPEAIYSFFERLEDARDRPQIQLRFVLALLLWRKKVLKLDRTVTTGDGEVWRFTAAGAGTLHHVLRPELDEPELERLSGQLEQLLMGQPEGPGGLVAAIDGEVDDA